MMTTRDLAVAISFINAFEDKTILQAVAMHNGDVNVAYGDVHRNVVHRMASSFLSSYGVNVEYDETPFTHFPSLPVSTNDIPELCERLHVQYLNTSLAMKGGRLTRSKSKDNLIERGAVYTPEKIAYDITRRTLAGRDATNAKGIKILDFATGTGRFYRQIVKCLGELYGIAADDAIKACIFAIDIDPLAVDICRLGAFKLMEEKDGEAWNTICKRIICRNALIRGGMFQDNAIGSDDFDGLCVGGFDAIVSNPPYLVLKPNKSKMGKGMADNINEQAHFFRTSGFYLYSIQGMLNLYQLSIEAMLGMLKGGGQLGIICPSTLFADVSASKLRKHLLSKHSVSYIKYFTEDDPLFDNVTQATCIFHLTKGDKTEIIAIEQKGRTYNISLDDVKRLFPENWEIPSIEQTEWNILRELTSFKRVKDIPFIRNKRGELDLTLYKEYITKEPTKLRLVRGNMISGYHIVDCNSEYVKPEFLDAKSSDYKENDFGRARLICQQISNQATHIRLHFALCEPSDILGNSCNYISVSAEYIDAMNAVLNSALLNWRFKITSTNNHINNYELDELPIADIGELQGVAREKDARKRDADICKLYGLNEQETNYILSKHYEAV